MAQTLFKLFFTQRLAALASTESLRAIREGLLWILPCLLVSAGFLILSECARVLLMSRDVIERIIGDTSGSSFDLALVLIAYLLLFLLNPMRNWINRRLYKRARRHAARQRLKAGA